MAEFKTVLYVLIRHLIFEEPSTKHGYRAIGEYVHVHLRKYKAELNLLQVWCSQPKAGRWCDYDGAFVDPPNWGLMEIVTSASMRTVTQHGASRHPTSLPVDRIIAKGFRKDSIRPSVNS